VEENKKIPIFVGGVEVVDLDDCDIPDLKLHCNSNDMDDNNFPNP
jgi:hypothetical protein